LLQDETPGSARQYFLDFEQQALLPSLSKNIVCGNSLIGTDVLSGELFEFSDQTHIWWGVSVENRKHGVPRIDQLRRAPVSVRFLSIEPLLEDLGTVDLAGIAWVIVGGESGHGAREMKIDWVRSIREQCLDANVPFFFKQWGGVRKHETGRELDGFTYDELPILAATA